MGRAAGPSRDHFMSIVGLTGVVTFCDSVSGFAYISFGSRAIYVPLAGSPDASRRLEPGMRVRCCLRHSRQGVDVIDIQIV